MSQQVLDGCIMFYEGRFAEVLYANDHFLIRDTVDGKSEWRELQDESISTLAELVADRLGASLRLSEVPGIVARVKLHFAGLTSNL